MQNRSEPSRRQEVIVDVAGMTCANCERHVSAALLAVPGVSSARASWTEGHAIVTADPAEATEERLRAAIAEAGYDPGDVRYPE